MARRYRSRRLDRMGLPRPPPERVPSGPPAGRDRPSARGRRGARAHRGHRARLRPPSARCAQRRRAGAPHRRRSGVAGSAARRRRGLVDLGPGARPRNQSANRAARARGAGGRRTGALDRAGAGPSMAVATAGGIHDDLVTPRCAPARVDFVSRGADPRRAARSETMNSKTGNDRSESPARAADIVREYGPFAGAERIHGVTHDGRSVWAATDHGLVAFDPANGEVTRRIDRPSDAGTAFDGKYLYQIAEARIDKIDPATGRVVASIPAPGHGGDSGLAWAEGSLWVGQYRDRKIHQIDPETGTVLRTIESDRFVTGVTWVDGELWHGTWEGDESDIRRIDPESGAVLERLEMPRGIGVSGLESDGADIFYCGGGRSGKVRAVRRPKASKS